MNFNHIALTSFLILSGCGGGGGGEEMPQPVAAASTQTQTTSTSSPSGTDYSSQYDCMNALGFSKACMITGGASTNIAVFDSGDTGETDDTNLLVVEALTIQVLPGETYRGDLPVLNPTDDELNIVLLAPIRGDVRVVAGSLGFEYVAPATGGHWDQFEFIVSGNGQEPIRSKVNVRIDEVESTEQCGFDSVAFEASTVNIEVHPRDSARMLAITRDGSNRVILQTTINGGRTWNTSTTLADFEVTDVIFHPTLSSTLFASIATTGNQDPAVLRSVDNGVSWQAIMYGPAIMDLLAIQHADVPAFYYDIYTPDEANEVRLWAAGRAGINLTDDDGMTWTSERSGISDVVSIAIEPNSGWDEKGRLFASTINGFSGPGTFVDGSPAANGQLHSAHQWKMFSMRDFQLIESNNDGKSWEVLLAADADMDVALEDMAVSNTGDLYVINLNQLTTHTSAEIGWKHHSDVPGAGMLNSVAVTPQGLVYLGTDQGIICLAGDSVR